VPVREEQRPLYCSMKRPVRCRLAHALPEFEAPPSLQAAVSLMLRPGASLRLRVTSLNDL
jgi:hypothetical protein